MITKFEAGKWYVCRLERRPEGWNRDGLMDFLLTGKPYLCNLVHEACPMAAGFEGQYKPEWRGHYDGCWCFIGHEAHFTEVPAPNEEKADA